MKNWGHKWQQSGPATTAGTPWRCAQCGAETVGKVDVREMCPDSPRKKVFDARQQVEQAVDICKNAASYAFLWNRVYARVSEEAPEALHILDEEVDEAGLPAVFVLAGEIL